MDKRRKDLSEYRLQEARDSLKAAGFCLEAGLYKDSINRSYYAAFYAIKAVLALGNIDFKRHKDVIAHFNQFYVATEVFPKEYGRKLGTLKQLREKSDYDDFYIASREMAVQQLETVTLFVDCIKEYLKTK